MNVPSINTVKIQKIRDEEILDLEDIIAIEEPLEIQLAWRSATGSIQKSIAVTMRTPGHDEELAAGFLFSEGIISSKEDISSISTSVAGSNKILVTLVEDAHPALQNSARNFYATSSCGICGKASIEAIRTTSIFKNTDDSMLISATVLKRLPASVVHHQKNFQRTGGIHASALFDLEGNFMFLKEDVGRHNALDKLVGAALMSEMLPLNNHILLLSGRASFELIQKAVMAGIKVVAAVGAPSSLAVEMALEAGITLAGFLKNDCFNVYAGFKRIQTGNE
ncbi:MAG TPA: formate dehydrogenase accessory sulfurtransferase FdhD [Agriterribacter sp.]|nr:formate dehydrogenase accessory sulfurtransferase FdhD [Agriterribacter sp.]